ncbi:MAG: VWA domain-containing protein [Armatimonadetes bacterium]|nr:VWA domain-containing protein [Armatimonadota bacterium]
MNKSRTYFPFAGMLCTIFLALLLAAPAQAQRRFPHLFTLNARSADTLLTPDATSATHRYRITAWGTYSMWEDTVNSSVDPVWIYSFPKEEWDKLEWRIFPEGYPIYVGDSRMYDSHGLRVDGKPFPKLTYQSDHRYSMIVQGTGAQISTAIVDWNFKNLQKRDAHDNNSGTLYVLVEELPNYQIDLCGVDSSRFPVIRVSVKANREGVRYEDLVGKLTLTEDGTPVRIDSINCAERIMPVSVAMVFDRSGSMRDPFGTSTRIEQTKAAGKTFTAKLAAIDEACILSFSDATTLDQPWTNSRPLLNLAIDNLRAEGYTAMNDAVMAAIAETEQRQNPRRAIVLLSDGEDNRSAVQSIQTVIQRAKQSNIPVFAIGLLLDSDDSLKMLAAGTGGKYFSVRDAGAMDSVFASIAELVFEKGCCSVYYTTPDRRRNGTVRRVEPRFTIPDDTTISGGSGSYRAPQTGVSGVGIADDAASTAIVAVSPNPLHDAASLRFRIGQPGRVVVAVINVSGQVVQTVLEGEAETGEYQQTINTDALPAGRYFIRLAAPGVTAIHGIHVVK